MKSHFKTIDNHTLVDRVEQNLVNLLHSRKLKVGDSIPKELELAELLGVSRTVVREALMRLRLMGLIESKKKKGSVITNPDVFSILVKSMNPYILSDETLRDIFELRLVMEVGMADLLVSRVTDEDIAQLKALVAEEPPTKKNMLFNPDFEKAFHGKLYEITENETLMKFQKLLLPIFGFVDKSSIIKESDEKGGFITHKDLVRILEKRNAPKFREAMRSHLDAQFKRILLTAEEKEAIEQNGALTTKTPATTP